MAPVEIDREELSWAAGFFDGEGCFSYSEAAIYSCVSIGQSDRKPLDRFKQAVGVGKVNGPYPPTHPDQLRRKPLHFYQAYGHERVQAIAAMLWFKLGAVKQAQAVKVLRRTRLCRRGHLKVQGHKGCGVCQAAYWKSRREGQKSETVTKGVQRRNGG